MWKIEFGGMIGIRLDLTIIMNVVPVLMNSDSFPEPSAPVDVKILGCTITQLKVGWDPPEQPNGILKGYYVFYGGFNTQYYNINT